VSCDPVAYHTLWSTSWLVNVNLNSREIVLRVIIGVVVAIWSIDIWWSLACKLHVRLSLLPLLGRDFSINIHVGIGFHTHLNMAASVDEHLNAFSLVAKTLNLESLALAQEHGQNSKR